MTFSLHGQSDADIDALVAAAHSAGVKVLVSIGGGGGDQRIIQFYNVGLSAPLVASLDKFVSAHQLDGVDLDIEDPSNMGAPFATLVSTLTSTFHPEGNCNRRGCKIPSGLHARCGASSIRFHQRHELLVLRCGSHRAAVLRAG
jgi:hypothetical protein